MSTSPETFIVPPPVKFTVLVLVAVIAKTPLTVVVPEPNEIDLVAKLLGFEMSIQM